MIQMYKLAVAYDSIIIFAILKRWLNIHDDNEYTVLFTSSSLTCFLFCLSVFNSVPTVSSQNSDA